jgi:hypothetical protein
VRNRKLGEEKKKKLREISTTAAAGELMRLQEEEGRRF